MSKLETLKQLRIIPEAREIAPGAYIETLPKAGEVYVINENLLLVGSDGQHIEEDIDVQRSEKFIKHVYVSSGSCEVLVNGQHIPLQQGDILHVGKDTKVSSVSKKTSPDCQLLINLHMPSDLPAEVLDASAGTFHKRSLDQTAYGYWIGGFVDNAFPAAKSSDVAIGVKVLQGPIIETVPHSHTHQFEVNAVLDGAYMVDVHDVYGGKESVVVHSGEMLVVGEGLFSGTQNIATLTESCTVYLIQSPNIQKADAEAKRIQIKSDTYRM